MATITVRQLVCNITTDNTWTQLTEGVGGTAYEVPTDGRADIKLLSGNNLGANDATITFAISDDSSISSAERIWPSIALATGEYANDDSVHVMRPAQGLWARAVGTTPNVTFNASILETV